MFYSSLNLRSKKKKTPKFRLYENCLVLMTTEIHSTNLLGNHFILYFWIFPPQKCQFFFLLWWQKKSNCIKWQRIVINSFYGYYFQFFVFIECSFYCWWYLVYILESINLNWGFNAVKMCGISIDAVGVFSFKWNGILSVGILFFK